MRNCAFLSESDGCPCGVTFDRNFDDILLEAESAKLGDTTTYSNSIVCAASSSANQKPSASAESVKLFQLSEQQTEMLLSNSTSFTIKPGPKNDNCMVFTGDKSFNIRSSETSNSLLFIPHLSSSTAGELKSKDDCTAKAVKFAPVRHSCKVYYELSEGRPKLSQALNLLRQSPTSENTAKDNNEQNISQKDDHLAKCCDGYTFTELCHQVQASETEVKKYLDKLNVMYMHEKTRKLRFLSDSYFTDVSMTILRRLEEESWDSSRVPRQECLECLSSLEPEDVLQFVFDKVFDPVLDPSPTSVEPEKIVKVSNAYKLNERAVCRLFTYYVLSGFEKMQLTQFEQVMTESLPDGVIWNFDYVTDCVITIEAPLKTRDLAAYVKYVPEWELPDDPPEKRLTELWKLKGPNGKWTLQQLGPYLLPILDNNTQALTALLTKHARSVADPNATGSKFFTKKY